MGNRNSWQPFFTEEQPKEEAPITITETLKISALYTAFFNRAPDQNGLLFWEAALAANGGDFRAIAGSFAEHPVFFNIYGEMNDREFVEAIYSNMLGSNGDTDGINFWTTWLSTGETRADMVAAFVTGSLVIDLDALLSNGELSSDEYDAAAIRQDYAINRADVGLKFADTLGPLSNIAETLTSSIESDPAFLAATNILAGVDNTQASVLEASARLNNAVKTQDPIATMASFTPISIFFDDPSNELASYYEEIESNIKTAWAEWDTYINAHTGAQIEIVVRAIEVELDGVLANAGSLDAVWLYDNVYQGNTEYELIHGEDSNGTEFDGVINISSAFLNLEGFYNLDPEETTAPSETSFEDMIFHELGHILGFGGWFDGGDITPYESFVQSGEFIGEHAVAANGGPVLLDIGLSHLNEDIYPNAAMGPYINDGGEDSITSVELGILADIGLPIDSQYLFI